ncbi:MAG: CBS domain-containing protein [Candidatus Hodarchaeaceae archaeon]|nr:CBS domain-containing protein [Candidatus Hodarchaeaceae archaeon]
MRILKPTEIRTLRAKLGLTQAQLAELAGVTQAYIAKIEAGTADPRVSTLEKILTALKRARVEKRVTAGQIMATPIISVRPNDKIEKAIRLMESYNISQLPILDGATQVGAISETTIMRKIADGEDMFKLVRRNVEETMDNPFPSISKDTDIDTVYHLLEHNPAVLVIDRGRAAGIVTKADVLKLVKELGKIK